MKVLEVLLTKPRVLQNKLTSATMFVCLMSSVKVRLQGHEVSCYEIFRTMLKHSDIHLLNGPFEDPVRALEDMPIELQKLAVDVPHPMSSFGLFLPIKKWSDLTIYEKGTFEDQLRKVIQSNNERMAIDPQNFLIRIPKFFLWKSGQDSVESRLTSMSGAQNSSSLAVALLRGMIADQIIGAGKTHDAI